MRIVETVTIARSPEEVWGFIADPANDTRWCEKVDRVEQLSGDGPGVRARYRVVHRPRPRKPPGELSVEIVEFDPPTRLSLREEDDDAVFDVAYELVPADGGARVTQIDEIEWKISPLLRPIARRMVGRDLRRQFANLKGLLETERDR